MGSVGLCVILSFWVGPAQAIHRSDPSLWRLPWVIAFPLGRCRGLTLRPFEGDKASPDSPHERSQWASREGHCLPEGRCQDPPGCKLWGLCHASASFHRHVIVVVGSFGQKEREALRVWVGPAQAIHRSDPSIWRLPWVIAFPLGRCRGLTLRPFEGDKASPDSPQKRSTWASPEGHSLTGRTVPGPT